MSVLTHCGHGTQVKPTCGRLKSCVMDLLIVRSSIAPAIRSIPVDRPPLGGLDADVEPLLLVFTSPALGFFCCAVSVTFSSSRNFHVSLLVDAQSQGGGTGGRASATHSWQTDVGWMAISSARDNAAQAVAGVQVTLTRAAEAVRRLGRGAKKLIRRGRGVQGKGATRPRILRGFAVCLSDQHLQMPSRHSARAWDGPGIRVARRPLHLLVARAGREGVLVSLRGRHGMGARTLAYSTRVAEV
jgi:hypothetical protein